MSGGGGSGSSSSSSSSSPLTGLDPASLRWPAPPLRAALCRDLAKLGAPRFCAKYPAVLDAMLKTVVEAAHKHAKLTAPKEVLKEVDEDDDTSEEARAAAALRRRQRGESDPDSQAPVYQSAKQLAEEEEARRRARAAADGATLAPSATTTAETAAERIAAASAAASSNDSWTAAPRAAAELSTVVDDDEAEAARERAEALAAMPLDVRAAEALSAAIVQQWGPPLETLSRAGKAFEGLEGLLGGGAGGAAGFDLGSGMWRRKGWGEMDSMRSKLEHLKELRDLVRSLGRGGGWGPLRRAPVQHLDERGRPGLLRTTLEAQETRGLCRSDDISRLLPSEAAMLARGRTVRASKLLLYATLAEKALQTYERDGWGEFDTRIPDPDRREVRPTADRGPILLCVDTSGSMRGPREVVAKALALECMRAAKVQERGCFVFAFAGPAEVAELELGMVRRKFFFSVFFVFFRLFWFLIFSGHRASSCPRSTRRRSFSGSHASTAELLRCRTALATMGGGRFFFPVFPFFIFFFFFSAHSFLFFSLSLSLSLSLVLSLSPLLSLFLSLSLSFNRNKKLQPPPLPPSLPSHRTPRASTASSASSKRSSTAAPTSTRPSRGASTASRTARGPTPTS